MDENKESTSEADNISEETIAERPSVEDTVPDNDVLSLETPSLEDHNNPINSLEAPSLEEQNTAVSR